MPDLTEFVEQIKKIAIDAVKNSKPVAAVFGTVQSVAPLIIVTEQKLTLGTAQLVPTRNVRNYSVTMTVAHKTEDAEGHSHEYKGTKTFTVHNGLSPGERVLLIQEQGGQRYVVMDRV